MFFVRTIYFLTLFSLVQLSQTGEITKKYQPIAQVIRDHLMTGAGKGQAYARIANLTDEFGPRVASKPAYKKATDFLVASLRNQPGIDRVWTETLEGLPVWSPGENKAQLLEPRNKTLAVLALDNSTATPPGGITAAAIVVQSFDELKALTDQQVSGKIVVFNEPWLGYGPTARYRGLGAVEAAKKGAVAALVRSVTTMSLYTLHGGYKQAPEPGIPDIPVASLTLEDAELLWRLQKAGKELVIKLELYTEFEGFTSSNTIIAEIEGLSIPQEMVIFGCHFDSVANGVGTGAMDDGGGIAITWETLVSLTTLGLRPKRTLRAVFWNAEEFGGLGGLAYYQLHKQEAASISLILESDTGTFNPIGFHYYGSEASQAVMQEVMALLEPINGSSLIIDGGGPGDPYEFLLNDNVPGGELYSDSEKYWWYHHSNADSITAMVSDDLDKSSVIYATVAYVVADLDEMLPKTGGFPSTTPDAGNAASTTTFNILLMTMILLFTIHN